MSEYKDKWSEKYEALMAEGNLSDIECAEAADDYMGEIMFNQADNFKDSQIDSGC